MQRSIEAHLEEYKEHGFTVFLGVYDDATMQSWREEHQRLCAIYDQWWFGNMLEYAPRLMLPAVANPAILDFAEQVMGPSVQLDNLTLAGFQSVPAEQAAGKVSGWHRDRWGQVPRSAAFERPLAINAICYLQDLTDEFGPLRVIPGSHRRPITIPPDERNRPHPEERLIHMRAGDVVVTHNYLIHSGTPNTSGNVRYFFSVYYNLTWLKHTDNHGGPRTQALLQEARKRHDRRLMRLLGVDEQLQARANSGFLFPDEQRWAEWAAEDRAALQETSA